ncbi:hypothetical protein [Cylindrospermum sp. FACHB-282]|uniref:hypothetical protein n=1 Tax=Cylindrospermum sp. FACHB-282 TaxID=2692794 RepID=UPI001688FC30|nr:hypothetical protein [Cylindrospermum sp. FACHB-282]MBD2384116.1 hypothetical protein [Cylindrospermum sp. FACHB-282]
MSFIRTGMNLSWSFLSLFTVLFRPKHELKRQHKAHDYSELVWGSDYIFESLNEGMRGCMTGFGKGIKPGDLIILQQDRKFYRYQIEEIDYYSDPADMWIALLKPVLIE